MNTHRNRSQRRFARAALASGGAESMSTRTPAPRAVPRLAEDALTRARLTVVPRRRVRAARMPFVTLVSLVLLGGVVGLLCFNTQMQQASFAATSLEAQSGNLAAREQTLHDELQALRNPQNLAAQAQAAGMVVPQSSCTVQLAAKTTDERLRARDRRQHPAAAGPSAEEAAGARPRPDHRHGPARRRQRNRRRHGHGGRTAPGPARHGTPLTRSRCRPSKMAPLVTPVTHQHHTTHRDHERPSAPQPHAARPPGPPRPS